MAAKNWKKLRKRLIYDGLDFKKDKHSVNISCNNVCLSNFSQINLFYIYIVWKCNNGDHFGIQNGFRMAESSVIIIWNKIAGRIWRPQTSDSDVSSRSSRPRAIRVKIAPNSHWVVHSKQYRFFRRNPSVLSPCNPRRTPGVAWWLYWRVLFKEPILLCSGLSLYCILVGS